MTYTSTEQERKLFEAFASDNGKWLKAIERDAKGNYLLLTTAVGWMWWQAARSAPVVPQGWKITEEMHVAAVKVLHRASGVDGLPQRMVDAMLAAAAQPPEAEKCQSCRTGSPYACTCTFKTDHNSDPSCFEVAPHPPEAAQLDDIDVANMYQVFDLKGEE
ncbi:Uncharacterised protein [uncultured Comamonas sp.]|nr:Uncharacterised protein [uncultured Comamonas sp.]